MRISIDDFGIGFCSFSYLLQYQVDRLKIDQSFVKKAGTDANAAAVVRTIIAMSHGLNIKVVAEGVETEDQLRFLLRRKCDEAQGYFIAQPLAPEEFCESVRTCSNKVPLRSIEPIDGMGEVASPNFTLAAQCPMLTAYGAFRVRINSVPARQCL